MYKNTAFIIEKERMNKECRRILKEIKFLKNY
jgi:hypothetical protein